MNDLIGFYGHHKCGTTWIRAIFERVSEKCGLSFRNFTSPGEFDNDLEKYIAENRIQVFSFVNAEYDKITSLMNCRAVHVIRDPRDIIVSGYFSHRYSHPLSPGWQRLAQHREKLEQVDDLDKGLMLEIEFARINFNRMINWNYADPNILEVKMEDIILKSNKSFIAIFSFLGLYPSLLKEGDLEMILDAESFAKKTGGRKPGEEDQKHHFRKGVSGDWKNYFKQEHKDYFKKQYQPLLEKLGYESDDNW